jgi:hypothetical protein
VTTLADVLELIHSADSRWRSVRAAGSEWIDYAANSRAIRLSMQSVPNLRPEPGVGFARVFGPNRPRLTKEPVRESLRWRIWLSGPDVARTELDHPRFGTATLLVHGDTWWSWHGSEAATSNFGDAGHGQGPLSKGLGLLRPSSLLPHAEFRYRRSTTLLDRKAFVVDAVPLGGRWHAGLALSALGLGGDVCRIVVDATNGVGLRIESWLSGVRLVRVNVEELQLDELLDESLFTPPHRVTDTHAGPRVFWRLSKLAAAVSHPVFVPRGVELDMSDGSGYLSGPHARVDEGDPSVDRYPAVTISYQAAHEGKTGALWISQSSHPFVRDEAKVWQEANGIRYQVGGAGAQVRLSRAGVFIHLESNIHSPESLVRVARSLEPLPAEPPKLVAVP